MARLTRRRRYEIDIDALWPRDEEHRYRIYARRGVDDLEILAATGSAGGIGEAIIQLDADERERGRRLIDRGVLGILDAVEGRWIILPWQRGELRATVGPLPALLEEEGRSHGS